MQASLSFVSWGCLIQPYSRIGKGGCHSTRFVYQESLVRKMHGHKFCWQPTTACVQEPKNTYSKGCSWMEYNLLPSWKATWKELLMSVSDRLLLRKRAIIETENDELKNIAQVEHSRHRCFDNFYRQFIRRYCSLLPVPQKAVYQWIKDYWHTACSVLNSSNSR